jgi:hypothetical protein
MAQLVEDAGATRIIGFNLEFVRLGIFFVEPKLEMAHELNLVVIARF